MAPAASGRRMIMRLIDADALIEEALTEGAYGYVDALQIAIAPTIDAVPVRHGRVIETIEDGRMKRVFSCCGTDFTGITCWMRPNFCPNCGAKMDEEVSEWMKINTI